MVRIITLIYFLSINILFAANDNYKELQSIESIALNNAAKYQTELNKQVQSIEAQVSSVDKKEFLKQQKEQLQLAFIEGKPKNDAQILVFVSFSMPKEALKSLLIQSEQYNAAIIIQGLVENSLPNTLNKITKLIKETNGKGGLQIDPNLFEEYKITSVPAIVLGDSDDFDVVYGLANIKDALEILKHA